VGSVKDLIIVENPKEKKAGRGYFVFSDRYSVFDWGEMPDHIDGKGASLCITSSYFFEKLKEKGVKTHYIGVVEGEKTKKLNELSSPTNKMEVKLLRVIKPRKNENGYDYSVYKNEKGNYLIPVEVIYRNSLPQGSSLLRRLKEGKIKPEDIGLNKIPEEGEVLEKPIIELSTKLEETDRYISWDEGKEISNLSDEEIEEIKRITILVNEVIKKEVEKIGLFYEDGKIEFGLDEERNLILIDAIGTLDECRLTYNGFPLSKEIARIYYRKTNWYKEVVEAKKKDKVDWKNLVKITPPPLPKRLKELISLLYKGYCNQLTERNWFNAPPFKDIIREIKDFF